MFSAHVSHVCSAAKDNACWMSLNDDLDLGSNAQCHNANTIVVNGSISRVLQLFGSKKELVWCQFTTLYTGYINICIWVILFDLDLEYCSTTKINYWWLSVLVYLLVTCSQAEHEIYGEPSTECSSGQPAGQPHCSTHGQRLREHDTSPPTFSCCSILWCSWSPYEMNDSKTGSLAHALLIQGSPGSFTCLGMEHRGHGSL